MILLYSSDIGQINFRLSQLFKNDYFVYEYDNNLDDIEEKILQYSFTESKKNILIRNLSFLKDKKLTKLQINFLETLKKSEFNIIITLFSDECCMSVKDYFKEVIELKKMSKFTSKTFINDYLTSNGLILGNELVSYISEKLPLDGLYIISELNKFLNFDKNEIDYLLIEKLICKDINETIFKLVNLYFYDEKEKMITILNDFDTLKIDYYEILNIFIAQTYNIKLYFLHFQIHKDISLIAKEFNIPIFQINVYKNLFHKLKINNINRLLKNLLKLNREVLSGKMELNYSLKLLFLKGCYYE